MRVFTQLLWVAATLLTLPGFSQDYIMNGSPITDCSGFFLDSGGNAGPHGPNQNLTTTICPDGSTGTHIRLQFPGVELGEGDILTFYDGPDTNSPQLSTSEDFLDPNAPFIIQATAANPGGCVTVTFVSDDTDQGAGWSAAISCIAACQLIQSVLTSTTPAVMPADTGWIDACPGQRVFFSGEGSYPQNGIIYNHSDFTSTFEWNFGDGATAVGPNVSHIYDTPGGYIVQLTITDQFGCTNTNFLTQRVRIAPSPQFEIGDIPQDICTGDTIQLNAVVDTIIAEASVSVIPTEATFLAGGVRSDSLPLPDGTGAVYQTSIEITDFSPGQILTNINDLLSICVNMEHSWMHDLQIHLECPDGTQIMLQNQEFISNEVFLGEPYELDDINTPNPPAPGIGYDYCWTPQATQTWTQYTQMFDPQTLPSGEYRSFQPMTNLLGCPLNGEWTIIVQDLWGSDNGWIFEWSINFNQDIYPNLESFTPQITDYSWQSNPSIFFQTQDSIAASPQNAGTAGYTFSVTNEFGCVYDTSVNVSVLPVTHPNCYSCADNLTEPDDVIICEGESAAFDVSAPIDLETDVVFETFPYYDFGFSNHPPINPYESTIAVNSIQPMTLADPANQIISVCINIETDWNSDLAIWLRAPSGQLLELSSGNGGGSDNYINTCFTPTAISSITTGTGPFTGNFQPEGNWNSLLNAAVNGNWTLIVSDAFGINDMGRFLSWSISFRSINEVNYTWSPATGLSCANCPDPVASPATTTTYTIQSSDSYGCVYDSQVTVSVVNNLEAPVVSCEQVIDNQLIFNWTQVGGFTDYEINVISNGTPSGWQGPVSGTVYVIDNLDPNEEIMLEVRVYTGGAPLTCDVGVGTATCINSTCLLSGTATNLQHISCFGANDGSVTITAANGQGPFAFYLDGSPTPQSSETFSGLTPGAHTVIVEDFYLCQSIVSFVVNEPAELVAAFNPIQPVSCFNGQDGSLTAGVTGGNGGYVFDWNINPDPGTATASNLGAGFYSVTVTDSEGCTSVATHTLADPEELVVNLVAQNPSCSNSDNGQVEAVVSGGTGNMSYQWNNGTSNAVNSGLSPGNICVTVTDANGCTATQCTDISAPDALVVNSITVVNVDCFGNATGSANVVAAGGAGSYTYMWSDPLGQISSTAGSLPAGDYTVTVIDANGCQVIAQATITQPTVLTVSAGASPALCKGGADGTATASPGGGVQPYIYKWNDNQTGQTATGLAAGIYFVTVTDANGCQAITSTSVGEPAEAVSLQVDQTFRGCHGQKDNEATVTPSGGTGSYTYLWSNGQQSQTATNLDSLLYFVTVTDANGCDAEISITPNDLPPITVNIIANLPGCYGYSDGALGINIVEGGAGTQPSDYTFLWNNNSTSDIIENIPGNQTYTVTVTDQQGCRRVVSRFLAQPAQITFDITTTDALCFGDDTGTASVANIQGDNDSFSFQWDANAAGQTTQTAASLSAGNYSVTVTDNEGCFSTGVVSVNQPTDIAIRFETIDNKCFGDQKGRISTNVQGGVPGYVFAWSNSAGTADLDNLPAGSYTLMVTDQNGCIKEATTQISQPALLTAQTASKDVACFGDRNGSITLTTQGGTPPYQYSLDNQTFIGSSVFIGLRAGDYNLFVKDAYGCTFFTQATVIEPDEFTVDAGEDQSIVLGDSISLTAVANNAQGAVEFVWSAPYEGTLSCTECPVVIAKPGYTITYELYGIDANGCEDTDFINVIVNKPRMVAVPTGFTPNGDGMNDRLLVHGQKDTRILIFQVFDRWGELLYEAADFEVNSDSVGWDGNFRDQPMSAGVYVWRLTAEYVDGVRETYKGQTTLIR
jgi:gliding motility-associated-like protein